MGFSWKVLLVAYFSNRHLQIVRFFFFHCNLADTRSSPTHVSFWQGTLSCLLGSKLLGILYNVG